MKKFIDCGTHNFQGLRKFVEKLKIDQTWEIYSFEANPYTFMESKQHMEGLDRLNIKHFNKAVSTKNENILVNCAIYQNSPTSQASNILVNPPNVDIVYGSRHEYIQKEVESIDFCDFLEKNTSNNDEIYIKMDIEGEEFDVLEKIILKQSYKNIKEIYIEFHERFFFSKMEEMHDKKNEFLKFFKDNGIVAEEWI